ncbi:MAG: peptide MFS transporter [Flavobacteriales bacterium]|jgi:POT family proton-dependent oligopeptide transporter|nr:peptide MFS transporter [Flavobacteriales bacterium]MBK7248504.1 peptide MFS transporter [Flavobacteriales bacterium]MBK7288613.1 peptide MFS transporter [Flavobacteriales bacterium]MBK9059275.1 peptide MFS transporter [Flavobacteriales bacterium]MBK9597792.1 peptide MFS transporter [Flavobacteriales bacterium]
MSGTSKHPKGLYVLFFTEMWERFGYYLMLGIFSLYMLDGWENGGMGFDALKKSDIYGTYLGLVYLTPFIGGLLADRILGFRKSIISGGLLMAAGYLTLAVHDVNAFYIGLLLIIMGNGMFKPNISTLVGNLYNDDKYRDNKDAGFNIFYMGINIGAFVCNFVAAFMQINYGWGYAFAAAGIGMLIGVVVFISGNKWVKHADIIKPLEPGDMSTSKILLSTLVPMFVFGVLGYLIPGNLLGTDTNDAFIFGCIPVVAFFIYLYVKANAEDKRPIGALLAVFGCLVIFWAVFHQNGDALTVWAKDYTNREMPMSVSNVADKMNMAETVTNNGAETAPNSSQYFATMAPENVPAQGQSLKLYSTQLYQSINPFWVVLLTPIIVGFWGFMRSRKREPSTPTKIAIGLVITALSALVMVGAVMATNNLESKASSWWLIASYGVITVGELCLSPMGLSLVSKLSPPRITALMMGGFFLSTSVGNKLSGMLSGLWEGFNDKSYFFLMNFGLALAAALMLFFMLRWLKAVMREKNIH